MRVRIMHVFVRRRLMHHPEWREADWGIPISQGDALITLMAGWIAPGFVLRLAGFRTSGADIDALYISGAMSDISWASSHRGTRRR